MIIIDYRSGSKDLMKYIGEDRAVIGDLKFGDAMLTGHGPDGSTITVGVEVKSTSDLLSSISTGRLGGHQIPGLVRSYDYPWLAVYGSSRPNHDNYLETLKGKYWRRYAVGSRDVPWSYMEGFLLTAQMKSPLQYKHLSTLGEVAKWLMVFDHWLEKPWDKHKGLSVFDKSRQQAPPPDMNAVEVQMARTAASFQSVDWTRGWAAAKHFESVDEMINATADEWAKVKGIGKVLARAITGMIRRKK